MSSSEKNPEMKSREHDVLIPTGPFSKVDYTAWIETFNIFYALQFGRSNQVSYHSALFLHCFLLVIFWNM